MQYDELAAPFFSKYNPPDWITENEINTLRKKQTMAPIINRENFKTTLTRISKLIEKGAYIQALVLSEELTFFYGKQPLSHITSAEIWKKLGFFEKSLASYKTVREINTIKDSALIKNIDTNIKELQKKSRSGFAKFKYKYDPQLLVYAGGMFSLTSANVNTRVGFHTNFQLSTSLNFSYSRDYESGSNSFYVGLCAYKRFFNLLAVGFGLKQSFGDGNYNIYVAPSIGLSFYKPRSKVSLDLFFNTNVPCISGEPQFTLSFGVTTYF